MTRRHDLDWIRVCAFALLVLYHVGMYYVTWDWHVKSPAASTALEPLMVLTSPWRLSLLFLVSGAATAFLLDKSRTGFLRARSWRLLVPLVFGMLVIVPPQAYYEIVEKSAGGYTEGYLTFWGRYLHGDGSFCRDGECLDLPTWNHLWFVAYLWVYTVLLWV
ncbi:MAG: acyltransferase family protein, partial [Luteimonas sp.]